MTGNNIATTSVDVLQDYTHNLAVKLFNNYLNTTKLQQLPEHNKTFREILFFHLNLCPLSTSMGNFGHHWAILVIYWAIFTDFWHVV